MFKLGSRTGRAGDIQRRISPKSQPSKEIAGLRVWGLRLGEQSLGVTDGMDSMGAVHNRSCTMLIHIAPRPLTRPCTRAVSRVSLF